MIHNGNGWYRPAPSTRYEVSLHSYGRRLITRDGPCQGLLEFPQHKWTRVNSRPLGIRAAIALADNQPHHAIVNVWGCADKAYDNHKPPVVPIGWWPAECQTPDPIKRAR
jgi:hypothetical protein